ncbi:hypothetical protein [Rhodoblastus sp.]|jgi:hypothetical protein|uniref:hypothetical protein n=1 Tax=Rhodoblastus sp. TaxID=1962975 RepID=UPI0025ED62EE|nr:hypothetical protein [Rhodoblastus sp.]
MNISPWDCPHISINNAITLLNRSKSTVYALICIGELKSVYLGRNVFVTTDSIKSFLHRVETGDLQLKNIHEAAQKLRRAPGYKTSPIMAKALKVRWDKAKAAKEAAKATASEAAP